MQQHGRGDGTGSRHQRDGERKRSNIAHMLLDRLFGGLTFAAHAHAEHHLEGDREQQQATGKADTEMPSARSKRSPRIAVPMRIAPAMRLARAASGAAGPG